MQNARLQALFKLSSKLTVFIPSTVEVDKPIDNKQYVDNMASNLSEWFGGATSTPCLGYWKSDSVGLVSEKTTMVFSYCSESDLDTHMNDVVDLCESIKLDMKQEAIAIELNGEMYFV